MSMPKVAVLIAFLLGTAVLDAQVPVATPSAGARSWVDATTGHRITRIGDDASSYGIYFDRTAFTPDGQDMIYLSPRGINAVNLHTLASRLVAPGPIGVVAVGTRTRRVFFQRGFYLFVADIDSGVVRRLGTVPPRGFITSINADESLAVGLASQAGAKTYSQFEVEAEEQLIASRATHQPAQPGNVDALPALTDEVADFRDNAKAIASRERLAARLAQDIFTVDLGTAQSKVVLTTTDWLNHTVFSPTDPSLILFAHEGPALAVDRVWTIRTDGTQQRLMYQRTIPTAIATNQFWSHDGKTIWFDLQSPIGASFSVAGVDLATGRVTEHRVEKAQASLHYNIAEDNTLFVGDGDFTETAAPATGQPLLKRQWIEVLRPTQDGSLQATRLVDLSGHDYSMSSPNARLSPDKKLVFFTATIAGRRSVYAVEVERADGANPWSFGSN